MCRFLVLVFCIVSMSVQLFAEAEGIKFIIPEEEQENLSKIEVDSSTVRMEPFTGKEEFQPLPEDSFASVLGMPEENIRWVPSTDPDMIHRLRICGTDSSFDGSTVLIAETTGRKNGPYGTRLILFSTTNLVILRVIELPCMAKEIRFEGSNGRIWFLREPQPDTLQDTAAVCILDAKSGKIVTEIPLKTLPERLYPHITGKFAWTFRKNEIRRLSPDGNEQMFLHIPEAKDVIFSSDRQYFCALTDSETKLFSSMSARLIGTYPCQPGNTLVFLAGTPPSVLIGKNELGVQQLKWPENVYCCSGKDDSRLITTKLSGPLVLDAAGTVFYALKPKNRLEKINAATGKVLGFANYLGIKPLVKGSILSMFPLNEPDRFLVLDSVGGFSKIETSGKRWKRIGSLRPWTE